MNEPGGTLNRGLVTKGKRRWMLVAGISLLVVLIGSCTRALWPFMQLAVRTYDPDMTRLMDAVENTVNPDSTIPSASYGLQIRNAREGKPGGYWFVIEISYTGICDNTARDPCEFLVNKLARIVFDNYSRVDDLAGIDILITDTPDVRSIHSPDSIRFEKMLSIPEWREELSVTRP